MCGEPSIALWLACCNKLMTNQERVHCKFDVDDRCNACGMEVEDVDHVLRNCVQTQMIWREVIKHDRLEEIFTLDFKRWIHENLKNGAGFAKENTNWDLMFGGMCWFIWLHRNSQIFDDQAGEPGSISHRAKPWFQRAAASCVASRVESHLALVPASGICRWSTPPTSWNKVNSNSAMLLSDGFASCGVIQDNIGH
ncbi:hypothetical protein V6N13_125497 [Hibiscus sabdariffa]|uniref:Reverse transcriptase zinc-binding domain-containing protein n=1 Tax=Hibiscus sabdariffa TaxID=183260 RepID=A0ABR2U6E2_9ROSI